MKRPNAIDELIAKLTTPAKPFPSELSAKDEEQICRTMDRYGGDGREMPNSKEWAWFHRQLKTLSLTPRDRPPGPLILAATPYELSEGLSAIEAQLRWASRRGGLDRALQWLDDIEYGRHSSPM